MGDKLHKYIGEGNGKNLSSLGDLLSNIASMSNVVAKKAEGLAPPGGKLKAVFSGDDIKVDNSVSKKGVLQVDKVEGHSGNWVFVNGHAVGLSNKLNDFEGLAVRMGHYEATLAKLTASLTGKAGKPAKH